MIGISEINALANNFINYLFVLIPIANPVVIAVKTHNYAENKAILVNEDYF